MLKRACFQMFVLLCLAGIVAAQDMAACDALTTNRLRTAAAACANPPVNSVCIGSQPVRVGLSGGEVEFLPGDTLALETVKRIVTGAASPADDTWGIALINTDAGLTAGSVSMILFGAASLESTVTVSALDLPVLLLTNTAGYDINLREGPGTGYLTTGIFAQNAALNADGRSLDNQWLRVRTDTGPAWVHVSLVSLDGDINTLAPLESLYTAPMQTFRLVSAAHDAALCGLSASGLLVSYAGPERVHLVANSTDIALSTATLLLQANADAGLQIHVLAGEARATAGGQTVGAVAGGSIHVPLNPDTLLAEGVPESSGQYAFAAVGGAPVDLTGANGLECVAGIVSGAASVTAYSGPGTNYSPLAGLEASSHYTVTGFALDAAQQPWWKLENNRWIPQLQVRTLGLCQSVGQVEAPPVNPVTPVPGTASLPAELTIYQAESGADVLTGQCTRAALAICSHPAAIKPNPDGTFYWRGQEPIDYLMTPSGNNTYAFSGRNFANNANLSLALTFTGATTWTMTMTTVFDDDPACVHTFYYTGVRR